MIVNQLYTKCLSEAAYYIESNNEAAIIDPLRDIESYIEMAQNNGATIKYIFETHFHADFVSGHLELAKRTGAKIIYGPNANPSFDFHCAYDGEVFKLGNITIEALHTPGHTLESTCFLLKDENNSDYCVFSGDTLFVGDVGRPDLAVKSDLISKEDLAEMLFDSLYNKIAVLDDHVIVYPGHGAGSACGKNIGSETFSTIGEQKATNYALQNLSKDQFVKEVTDGLLQPPKYFFTDVMMNKNGVDSLNDVVLKNLNRLTIDQLIEAQSDGAVVLDTRNPSDFAKGFLKGSINIGLNGQFAPWVGAVIDTEAKLVLVCDSDMEKETLVRLARVGFENVIGFVYASDFSNTILSKIKNASPSESATIINASNHLVLDVRKPSEVDNGYVLNSTHIRLQELDHRHAELDKTRPIIVYCAGGYRSMISCSILLSKGFENLVNVSGGYSKLKHEDITLSNNACKL